MGAGKCWGHTGAQNNPSIFPNFQPFAAIAANVNVLAAGHQFAPKLPVIVVVPYLPERLGFHVAQLMHGVFIEATGHH